ncbi:protein of unknown function [Methylocaldum szegediense]|uniref:Uncharacterized protein n=1 Tax=Methylocaldum szegediense TaxID=73780 RepID=A0ABM9I1Q7_9GAMM|nr:protein of unknown function [Methylocaldum szegediense]
MGYAEPVPSGVEGLTHPLIAQSSPQFLVLEHPLIAQSSPQFLVLEHPLCQHETGAPSKT